MLKSNVLVSPRIIACAVVLFGLLASQSQAAVVVVTPGSMDGWAFYKTSGDPNYEYGQGDAVGQMVPGPAIPPQGIGSANLFTGSDGSQSSQLRNSSWAGTPIAALTSLSYSTYATLWNGQQLPYLTMYLSNGDRLVFEPTYSSAGAGNGNPNPQSDPALNTWQTWNTLNGMWYSDNFPGPGSNAESWTAILADEGAGVTIVNDSGHGDIGGIRIASGFASLGDMFNTFVDAFTIGTDAGVTTYDFEPASGQEAPAVPEPASMVVWSLLALSICGFGWFRRRKLAA